MHLTGQTGAERAAAGLLDEPSQHTQEAPLPGRDSADRSPARSSIRLLLMYARRQCHDGVSFVPIVAPRYHVHDTVH